MNSPLSSILLNINATHDISNPRIPKLILLTSTTILFCALLSLFYAYVLNAPYWDDYYVWLRFAGLWIKNPDWSSRLNLLFEHHAEQLIPLGRIVALIILSITNVLNFKVLALCGILTIPTTLLALYKIFEPKNVVLKPLLFIPALFLIQPLYFEAITWATNGLSYAWVFPLALWTFYLSTREDAISRIFTPVLRFCAIFTNGNGIAVLPLTILSLIITKRGSWKRDALTLTTTFCFALAVGAVAHWNNTVGTNTHTSLLDPTRALFYFLRMLGSNLSFWSEGAGLFAGICIIVLAIIQYLPPIKGKNIALLTSLTFAICSLCGGALIRSKNLPETALSSRYQFMSAIAFTVIMLLVVEKQKTRKTQVRIATVLSIFVGVYLICAYSFAPLLLEQRQALILHPTLEWAAAPGMVEPAYPDKVEGTKILELAEETGIYRLPIEDLAKRVSTRIMLNKLPTITGKIAYAIDPGTGASKYLITVFGWACIASESSTKDTIQIVLDSEDGHTYIFSTKPHQRSDITRHFQLLTGSKANHDNAGFVARIGTNEIPAGNYRVGLILQHKKHSSLTWTDSYIKFNNRN